MEKGLKVDLDKDEECLCLFDENQSLSKKNKEGSSSSAEYSLCGGCLIFFFVLIFAFFFWAIITMDLPLSDEGSEPPLILETDRLPMLSPDKKIIYVASAEGLPIAHNFILRNPSIPIEKIVYRKPGPNNTVHVYPIQREGLWATKDSFFRGIDIPALCAVISVFITIIVFAIWLYVWMKDFFGDDAQQFNQDGFDEFYSIFFATPLNSPPSSPKKPVPKGKWRDEKNPKELEPLLVV